jgi:hypothetical protein
MLQWPALKLGGLMRAETRFEILEPEVSNGKVTRIPYNVRSCVNDIVSHKSCFLKKFS